MIDGAFEIRSFGQGTSFGQGAVTAVEARSGRSFPRHSHDEFGIGLITAGAQRSWSGRGPVEATCGHVITVNPGEVHDGAPIGSARAWSMLYLAPEVVAAVALDLSNKVALPELHAPVVTDPRAARRFASARDALDRDLPAFEAHLIELLAALLGARPAPRPVAALRLRRVRERIDDDPAAPHALADLASVAGLSRFETLRAFARMTGLTPHAYVVQRRLEQARRLIRAGGRLADAAATAGFSDQSHLHRAFVARYGVTPGAYASALTRPRNFVQSHRPTSR